MLSASTNDTLNNITKIFEQENLRKTVTATGKAGLIVGACTMAGGLLGGKYGIAMGGIAGTALNSYLTPEFKAVPKIIKNDMTDEQKTRLAYLVQALLQRLPGAGTVSDLLTNDNVRAAVISTVLGFVANQGLGCVTGCRN